MTFWMINVVFCGVLDFPLTHEDHLLITRKPKPTTTGAKSLAGGFQIAMIKGVPRKHQQLEALDLLF